MITLLDTGPKTEIYWHCGSLFVHRARGYHEGAELSGNLTSYWLNAGFKSIPCHFLCACMAPRRHMYGEIWDSFLEDLDELLHLYLHPELSRAGSGGRLYFDFTVRIRKSADSVSLAAFWPQSRLSLIFGKDLFWQYQWFILLDLSAQRPARICGRWFQFWKLNLSWMGRTTVTL